MTKQTVTTKQSHISPTIGLIKLASLWFAIFAPVVLFIIIFVIPNGDVRTLSHILKITDTMLGKIFLFFMMSLPSWYAFDRILLIFQQFQIYLKRGKLISVFIASIWTLHAYYILFMR